MPSQSMYAKAKGKRRPNNIIDLDDINDDDDSDGQPDLLLDDPEELDIYEELEYDNGRYYRKRNKS